MIEELQSIALVGLGVACVIQGDRLTRLNVARMEDNAKHAGRDWSRSLADCRSDDLRRKLDDRQVRLECLQLATASYDPIDGRPAKARELVAAADVLARFVLDGPDA